MSELAVPSGGTTVGRWRRYGHDRLYVKDVHGTDLGFWDLKTDTAHPSEECWRDAVCHAASAWRSGAVEPVVEPVKPVALPTIEPVERPWVDLATNRPAEETRARAEAAYAAAPVRSAFGRLLGVPTEETSWRRGAQGEEKVAARLAKVVRKDPRWRVLHAIPVGKLGSDIDHLAIGPGGVFTINAKHHRGAAIWVGGQTFMVNGQKYPYVRNARFEAERAGRLLTDVVGSTVTVEGLIVPVNADSLTIKNQPPDVQVVARMQLATWLLRHGAVLDVDRIEAIYEAARRSTTWRP